MSGPKYRHAVDAIKAKIASGEVAGEITLGRIRELTGATDSTARRTAGELVAEGILENHPGAPYTVVSTPEDAAASQTDGRPLREQVAAIQREITELRQRLGHLEASLITLQREHPRGGRERAKTAAGGGQR